MSKLEDLKNEAIGLIEGAWHALEGSADVEAARELVAKFTADAKAKAEDIAEHLFYHVVGNANPPTETPAAPVETPAPAAPEGTVPDPAESVTGMAPPVGQPETEPTPVPAETPGDPATPTV